jgi:hypothetical protein
VYIIQNKSKNQNTRINNHPIVGMRFLSNPQGRGIGDEASFGNHHMQSVRYSAIEGILHRYHRCGPIVMLEDKGICRGSSLQMAFRVFRCHKAPKTNEGSLDPSFGDL